MRADSRRWATVFCFWLFMGSSFANAGLTGVIKCSQNQPSLVGDLVILLAPVPDLVLRANSPEGRAIAGKHLVIDQSFFSIPGILTGNSHELNEQASGSLTMSVDQSAIHATLIAHHERRHLAIRMEPFPKNSRVTRGLVSGTYGFEGVPVNCNYIESRK